MKTPARSLSPAELTELEEIRRGLMLAEVLRIRKGYCDDADRYPTEWGIKTELGLYRTVRRIVLEGC